MASFDGAEARQRGNETEVLPSLTAKRPAIVVMGVCGSGKSTFAEALAARLALRMVDGDDLHAETAIAKMRGGQPLGDEDRWPWLDNVAAVLADSQRAPGGVVVACSALKRVYRDRIRSGPCATRFVFLDASHDLITARMKERQGHFMPQSLVDSQFRTLERPTADESDVLSVPASLPPSVAIEITVSQLALRERF